MGQKLPATLWMENIIDNGEKMKENKKDKEVEKYKRMEISEKYFIGMSALSGVLLIIVAVLVMRPPKVEYIYKPYPSNNTTTSDKSSNSSTTSEVSSSYSSASSTDASNTTTYVSGEKIGTSMVGATIEVEQIIKHYQGYTSFYSICGPKSGYEYVLVKLSFKNNSANAIKMYDSNFYLKDSGGMMDTAESYDGCYNSKTTIFPFDKEITGGGTAVSGVMIFPVRKGMMDSLTLLYEKDTPKKRISIDL